MKHLGRLMISVTYARAPQCSKARAGRLCNRGAYL